MKRRFLFIALDAADFSLIQQWTDRGELPTLGRIISQHRTIPVQNEPGLYVGSVWPTISTGTTTGYHGRYCWKQLRAGTYDDEFIQANQINGEPVWDQLDRQGHSVCVIDIPKSLPSLRFKGRFVKDWGTHDPSSGGFQIFGWKSPANFIDLYGRDEVGRCDSINKTPEGIILFRDQLIRRAQSRAQMICDILAEGRDDIILTSFSEAHCVGHQCWHIHDRSHEFHDEEVSRQIGDPVLDVYKVLDVELGRILENVSEQDTIMLLATHGMGTNYNAVESLNAIVADLEFDSLTLSEQQEIKINGIPHLLSSSSRYFRRLFRVFPVSNNGAYAAFRLNIKGREPEGKLRQEDAEKFLLDFYDRIRKVKNADTGEDLFVSSVFRSDIYKGPLTDNLPDLMLKWNRKSPIKKVQTPWSRIKNSNGDNPRSGDHKEGGALWVLGQGKMLVNDVDLVKTDDIASWIKLYCLDMQSERK